MPDENNTGGEATPEKELETPPEGGKGTPAEETKVKIGDVEYTPDQLTQALKKATDYDALLPEFTTKSQMLSKLLGGDEKVKQEELPSFLKEGWKPKSFQELGAALKESIEWGENRATAKQEQTVKEAKEAKETVDTFYAEVRKANKDFDQEDFGEYVKRHGVKIDTLEDLKSAYSQYAEADLDGKAIERRTLHGKNLRGKDSVSTPSSGGEALPFNPQEMRARGGRMLDLAKQGLSKFNK